MKQVRHQPTNNYNMSQQPKVNTHHVYRPYEDHIPLQTHTNQTCPNQTSLDLNESVIKHLRCHSMQCLHQQVTDAINRITRSSSHQENLHFINDIPIFKAKDPKPLNDWLEQIDKTILLTNKDP